MRIHGVILAIEIIQVYSASKISLPNDDEPLTIAAANIVDRCLAQSESWSELVIIPSHDSSEILEKIHHQSKTANLIVFPNSEEYNDFTRTRKRDKYSTDGVVLETTKPTAIIIISHSLRKVEYALSFLKKDSPTIWKPDSYFLIILETKCETVDISNMFKVIWEYWILNAIILCSKINHTNRNLSEIELYTFNPYSSDHSQHWKTIINETIEVSMYARNFTHSWYIFKQSFTGIRTFKDCSNIFFDKTSNLDGYVIPIGYDYPGKMTDELKFGARIWFGGDAETLNTLSKKLRFNSQALENGSGGFARMLENGSYTGMFDGIYTRRMHFVPAARIMEFYPGIGTIYPHDKVDVCIASWNAGNRPYWMNFAAAKQIWIGLGVGIVFSTLVLYLQNKSHGIVSAILDAERLLVGSSIIRTPTVIKHRIIIGSIFVVVLVIDGAIRGRFISILTAEIPRPKIKTIEQLEQLDIDVYGHSYFEGAIINPRLRERFYTNISYQNCLNIITERKNFEVACLAECKWLLLLAPDLSDVYKSPTPAWSRVMQFYTAFHWPMADRFSFEVQKLIETGIYKKWRSDIDREMEVSKWKLKRKAELLHVRQTKLNDLLPAFAVLVVGLSLALIVFVWEKIRAKNHFCVKR